MPAYHSDSSDAEDSYTETNVLLGYASQEASDDTISYLGGRPIWLDPTTPPPASLAKCKVCNDLMVLLIQLNGDLPEIFPGHERRLYVLACKRKGCRRKEGCVRVIRGVRCAQVDGARKDGGKKEQDVKMVQVEPKEEGTKMTNIGESLFGASPFMKSSNANPFSTSSSGSTNAFSTKASTDTSDHSTTADTASNSSPTQSQPNTDTLPQTFASALNLNLPASSAPTAEPPTPWPSDSLFPQPYPLSYISEADYETLDNSPPSTSTIPLPKDIPDMEPDTTEGKEDKETFESTLDKIFQKFADRLAQNPEQVIRYEFKGKVLLYSRNDGVGRLFSGKAEGGKGIPRCGNCGGERGFEVQLTPHAIMVLEKEEEGLDGMEWGTVIVGVCAGDCMERGKGLGEVGYLEEWVGVQWEETR